MSDDPTIIFLEADDEITSVVRRVREASAGRVVIVTPGRSRATSSAIALRLLVRAGEEDGRPLAVVGDALTRSLAAEAGLPGYASVDDARVAAPLAAIAPDAYHAAIHVVRGPADETVVSSAAPLAGSSATETRPVSVVPARRSTTSSRSGKPRRRRSRSLPLIGMLVVAATLLGSAALVGATVLPAATIRLVPRSEVVGPVAYEITIEDPERISGTVTDTATVTATGSYAIQAAATGGVVFFNWNFVPVEIEAGSLVAAGQQAFATAEAIVVPPGDLTDDGRIGAGEMGVAVTAAAVGPAANVPAGAIDQVLNEQTAQRLRGFPRNPEPLVTNPEPTAGGVDTTGVEITQADVDAAAAALRESLAAMVAERLDGTDEGLYADAAEPPAPVITGADGLAGSRDPAEIEIAGELAYDRLVVDEEAVEARARERFASDADLLPAGHQLLGDATSVEVGAVERQGQALVVVATVRGRSAPRPGRADVLERVIGLAPEQAEVALAPLGAASVELWPGWVAEVPDNEWRIDVQITGIDEPEPVPSGS